MKKSDCQACEDRYDLVESIAGIIHHLSDHRFHPMSDADKVRHIETVFARIHFPPDWIPKFYNSRAKFQIEQKLEAWRIEHNVS